MDFAPFKIFVIFLTPMAYMHKLFVVCRCTSTQIKDFDLLIPTVLGILKSDKKLLSYGLLKKVSELTLFSHRTKIYETMACTLKYL